jgi:hypothetical protein
MKSIFRLFLLMIVVVIGAPVGAGVLIMQPGVEVPTYYQDFDHASYEYQSLIDSKVQTVLVSNLLGNKTVSVDEETISKIIHKEMDGFEGDEFKLTISPINTHLSLDNSWVNFDDGFFHLNGLFTVANRQTSFSIKLLIEDFDGYTKITFGTVKLGKLPLPKVLFTQGLSYVESNIADLESNYELGEISLTDLYVTVDDSYLNDVLQQELGTDVVSFISLVLDDQNVQLNYEFIGQEGEAVNTMIAEFNQVIANRESFKSQFNKNLTEKTNLEETKLTEITERVDAVLVTLDQKVKDNNIEMTADEKQVFQDLVDSVNTIENPETQDQVSTVFINTIVDKMEPENKTVIADYLNISVEQLDDANYNFDHTYLNDLFDQFFGK